MKRNRAPVILGWLILFCCLMGTDRSDAGEPADRVRGMLDQVISIQNDPSLQGKESEPQRRAAIQEIIAKSFNLGQMAETALGPHWKPLNAEQQAEFRDLFRELFEDSYTRLVLDFVRKEKIQYTGEEMQQDGALVKTTMVRPQEQISVDYLLGRAKTGWLVRDVSIDGVSIVENYRRSFEKVIARDSFKGLMDRLQLQRKTIEKKP